MHVRTQTHTQTHTYTYTHADGHTRTHTHTHRHTHTHTQADRHTLTHRQTHTHTNTQIYKGWAHLVWSSGNICVLGILFRMLCPDEKISFSIVVMFIEQFRMIEHT